MRKLKNARIVLDGAWMPSGGGKKEIELDKKNKQEKQINDER